MPNLTLSVYSDRSDGLSAPVSKIQQFKLDSEQTTIGVAKIGAVSKIGFIHWGYAQTSVDYTLTPVIFYPVDPFFELARQESLIRSSTLPCILQMHYNRAVLWRNVCKWAIQNNLASLTHNPLAQL